VLRGSGARGLAGLAVKGPLLRPLLEIPRATIERYARARGLEWLDDPSNASRAFLRNRIRHDLLPALRAADASIEDELWSVGQRASRWRAEAEALLDERFTVRHPDRHTLVVAAQELAGYDRDSLCVLWGVLAGRVGLALDRRGTHRCAAFTMERRRGTIPLSGGWRLEATRDTVVLRRAGGPAPDATTLPSDGTLAWGGFRFSVADDATTDSSWSAWLEESDALTVRRWRAGDRLGPSRGQGKRRVARYLTEARVQGGERERWPVVVRGEEVVWIPGVRRSDAATARSGRPARHYLCERAGR
jgi:tRNA(Ile)-lysidine synthetase-like protein